MNLKTLNESVKMADDAKMDKLLKGKNVESFVFSDAGLKALASANKINDVGEKGVVNRKITVYVGNNKDELVKLMHIDKDEVDAEVLKSIVKEFNLTKPEDLQK